MLLPFVVLAACDALLIGGRPGTAVPSLHCRRHSLPMLCDAAPTAADPAAAAGIVTFSDRAMQQLDTMKAAQNLDMLTLRMGVRAGGCSGMSYVMDLAKPDDDTEEGDTVVSIKEGMQCLIDPKSLMFLFGLHLDYSDELIGGGFSFQNPNAESECGCGKSFGV